MPDHATGASLHQLHHERQRVTCLFEPVDLRDVRMIEGGEGLRFAAAAGDERFTSEMNYKLRSRSALRNSSTSRATLLITPVCVGSQPSARAFVLRTF